MSYELSYSEPKAVLKSAILSNDIYFNERKIPMSDFVHAIEYVLTNSDLYPNDPRIRLIEKIKKSFIVSGWNASRDPNCKKIELPTFECPLCGKPSDHGEVHKDCSDREAYLASK